MPRENRSTKSAQIVILSNHDKKDLYRDRPDVKD